MDDDTVNPLPGLVETLGAYIELYPSVRSRLLDMEKTTDPDLRRKFDALRSAILSREADRRERLGREWGLTATEARLAIHLADGGTVGGYASVYGVAKGTVRTQLKAVFAKTGVNRQSALLRVVNRRRDGDVR